MGFELECCPLKEVSNAVLPQMQREDEAETERWIPVVLAMWLPTERAASRRDWTATLLRGEVAACEAGH